VSAFADAVREEERRRNACWSPKDRWRAILDTIAWADAQQRVPRNSKPACLDHQRRLLQRFARRAAP
jgi:hypothetical protein